jgi:hypothetical protein
VSAGVLDRPPEGRPFPIVTLVRRCVECDRVDFFRVPLDEVEHLTPNLRKLCADCAEYALVPA